MEIEEAQSLIFEAIRALNDERPEGEQIPLSSATALFGVDSQVDSLGLVSLIVDVEGAVSACLGRTIALTDDRAMTRDVLPFSSVGSLAEYIVELAHD